MNVNGLAHGHNLSEPVVPLQRDFLNHLEKEVNGKETNGSIGARSNLLMDQTRRTVSMSNAIPPLELSAETPLPPVDAELIRIHHRLDRIFVAHHLVLYFEGVLDLRTSTCSALSVNYKLGTHTGRTRPVLMSKKLRHSPAFVFGFSCLSTIVYNRALLGNCVHRCSSSAIQSRTLNCVLLFLCACWSSALSF